MSDALVSLTDVLGELRRELFPKATYKQFYQERPSLVQAVTFPASYILERFGIPAPIRVYKRAIDTVIATIKAKGNRAKIDRFSLYFLHCIQEHLKHHGEEYAQEAKRTRRLAEFLPEAQRRTELESTRDQAQVLVEAHRTLTLKSGRKKKAAPAKQMKLI